MIFKIITSALFFIITYYSLVRYGLTTETSRLFALLMFLLRFIGVFPVALTVCLVATLLISFFMPYESQFISHVVSAFATLKDALSSCLR